MPTILLDNHTLPTPPLGALRPGHADPPAESAPGPGRVGSRSTPGSGRGPLDPMRHLRVGEPGRGGSDAVQVPVSSQTSTISTAACIAAIACSDSS